MSFAFHLGNDGSNVVAVRYSIFADPIQGPPEILLDLRRLAHYGGSPRGLGVGNAKYSLNTVKCDMDALQRDWAVALEWIHEDNAMADLSVFPVKCTYVFSGTGAYGHAFYIHLLCCHARQTSTS